MLQIAMGKSPVSETLVKFSISPGIPPSKYRCLLYLMHKDECTPTENKSAAGEEKLLFLHSPQPEKEAEDAVRKPGTDDISAEWTSPSGALIMEETAGGNAAFPPGPERKQKRAEVETVF